VSPGIRTCAELWALIEEAFESICHAYNRRWFIPLLEADLSGYAYHAIVGKLSGDASGIHLDTRVLGGAGSEKYDLVFGACVETEERRRLALQNAEPNVPDNVRRFLMSKAALSEFRPAVRPELVIEFKFFAAGFTPPQLREHFVQAQRDAPKLGALQAVCLDGRGLVLFDDAGYMSGQREARIIAQRAEDDHLRVYLFQRTGSGEMKWRRIA